jgi:hypothetical protein
VFFEACIYSSRPRTLPRVPLPLSAEIEGYGIVPTTCFGGQKTEGIWWDWQSVNK